MKRAVVCLLLSMSMSSMSYKTYRNKSKAKRDELRKEYEEDTGKSRSLGCND